MPSQLHAPALAAQAPTIHAVATLTLLPLLRLPAASAVAEFPALRSLSLSRYILWPHATVLMRVLSALPALAALYLADCGLCGTAMQRRHARRRPAQPAGLQASPSVTSFPLKYTTAGALVLPFAAAGLRETTALTSLFLTGTLTYRALIHQSLTMCMRSRPPCCTSVRSPRYRSAAWQHSWQHSLQGRRRCCESA